MRPTPAALRPGMARLYRPQLRTLPQMGSTPSEGGGGE
jgi:hypothetical protein